MKIALQNVLLTMILFALAVICFESASFVMKGFNDCSGTYCIVISSTTPTIPCADDGRLALSNFFGWAGIVLFSLAFFLPVFISFRNRPIPQTKFLIESTDKT